MGVLRDAIAGNCAQQRRHHDDQPVSRQRRHDPGAVGQRLVCLCLPSLVGRRLGWLVGHRISPVAWTRQGVKTLPFSHQGWSYDMLDVA